jgi:ribonuclease HI
VTPRHPALIVYCDGAARGNPGPAGAGVFIVTPEGEFVAEIAQGLGRTTNNVAEYTAVILGLERARALGARQVLVRSDSLLLVNQLSGTYRVRSEHLKALHQRVTTLAAGFEKARFEHVPRGKNIDADRLANEGVDRWLAAAPDGP